MSHIELCHLHKHYAGNPEPTLHDFNLTVDKGEFVVFVGPSGCGKSTTLRMIAGLEEITSGELYIHQELMNHVEPKDRDIAMVFQSYALYPFLSVYDNIGFGLKIRKVEKKKRDTKIKQVAETLGLTAFLHKKPKDLSGGQRQRVALGRAIVKESSIFLMDEPLSNLDAKLRLQMREEIVRLQRELGSTTIYVTHDQVEAMTMADRIVLLKDGHIQQIGTPREIYQQPANLFVASFMGTPAMNFIRAKAVDTHLYLSSGEVLSSHPSFRSLENKDLIVGIRPESIELHQGHLKTRIAQVELLGADYHLHTYLAQEKILLRQEASHPLQEDQEISLSFPPEHLYLFDPQEGKRLEGVSQ